MSLYNSEVTAVAFLLPHQVEEFSEDEPDAEGEIGDQEAAQFGWFDDLYVFNTTTLAWSQPMQMNLGGPSPRAAHAMAAVDGKYLVIFGGRDAEARRNDVHIFDTGIYSWRWLLGTLGSESVCDDKGW